MRARTSASRSAAASMVSESAGPSVIAAGPPAGRSADPGVVGGRPLDELPCALAAGELPIADDHRAAAEDDVRPALDLASLIAGVVDVHVMRLRADRVPRVRVVDHEVGVRADRDRALRGKHPEELRRRRGDGLDPALLRDPAGDHATVVEQVDAVLHAGQPVRDLAEVAVAERLLALEVERAMVRGDELEVVLDQAPPELVLVVG